MARIVYTGEVLHKRRQVEFDVENAHDVRMDHRYDDRLITPLKLVVFFEQFDSDPVVADTIRVIGPMRKKRGEGYLKNAEGQVDYGAYWLTKEKFEARVKELGAPTWVLGQLLTIWPDSL
jgi:hypothetical protein